MNFTTQEKKYMTVQLDIVIFVAKNYLLKIMVNLVGGVPGK